MLKCLNRVRSFQEDPAACEGAFVDEAAEDGCSVADLAPHELENRYYSLKQISSSSPPADEDDEELEDKEAEADESSDDNNLSDSDSDNTEEMHHKHKHHHRQTKDGRTDSSNDDETTHSPYNANVILNDDNAANVAEIEDIEVDLPQNQFPDIGSNGAVASSVINSPSGYTSITFDGDANDSSDTVIDDKSARGEFIGQAIGKAGNFLQSDEFANMQGAVSGVQNAAQTIQGVNDQIADVEGKLSEVEWVGSKAGSIMSSLGSGEGMGGIAHGLSGVINLGNYPLTWR